MKVPSGIATLLVFGILVPIIKKLWLVKLSDELSKNYGATEVFHDANQPLSARMEEKGGCEAVNPSTILTLMDFKIASMKSSERVF
jgi:hypothetical protein